MVRRTLIVLLLSACQPSVPDGRLECMSDDDCPDDWHCWSDERCHREPETGSDAGADSGSDANVDSGTDAPIDVPGDVTADAADTSTDVPADAGGSCVLDISSQQARLLVPATASLFPDTFTWEMWIRFDTFDENAGSRLFFVTAESGGDGLFYLRRFMGALECVIGGGGGTSVASASPSLTLGDWYHVACVRDSSQLRLFLDGEQIASSAGVPFAAPTTNIGIGGDYRTPPEFSGNFLGQIDDVRISNIARYTAMFTPDNELTEDANTVALWKFSACAGATADDDTGTYSGSLLNSASFATVSRP